MSWVRAVALDLDGTIASRDAVAADVVEAIARARRRGTLLFLVTGRTVASLDRGFPGLIEQFDGVVAENGCVLVGVGRHRLLAEPVSRDLAAALEHRGMRLGRGEVLLATSAENDSAVLREITELGLDHVLLRNRGELMVLPAGVSKGSGLRAALDLFGLSAHNVIAVGDAENDQAMFEVAELSVATANAVSSVRERADLLLDADNGRGVVALLDGPILIGERRLPSPRRRICVGTYPDGEPTRLPSSNTTMLIVGGSGRGKSYLAGVVTEQLLDAGHQVLVIDPEGEQAALAQLPLVDVVPALDVTAADLVARWLSRGHSVVLDLSALNAPGRSELLRELGPKLVEIRVAAGVPHWVVVDEAHMMMSADGPLRGVYDPTAGGHILVTFHPEQLSPEVLCEVDLVLSSSPPIDQLIDTEDLPASSLPRAAVGHALLLKSDRTDSARTFTVAARITAHQRHQRKYAHSLLSPGKGFRFRESGRRQLPEALSIEQFQAQLHQVDPDTLGWHLRRGDLSRWLGEVVQDRELARLVAQLERDLVREQQIQVLRGRDMLSAAIDDRYLTQRHQDSTS